MSRISCAVSVPSTRDRMKPSSVVKLADCARNLPLIVLMNALADLTANVASALDASTRARHRLRNCRYHRQIFEAIRRRDGDAAYTIMAEHVGDIQKRVHQCLTASRGNGPRSS